MAEAHQLDVVTSKAGTHPVLLAPHPGTQDVCSVFSKTKTEKYKCNSCKVTIEVVFERDVETGELIDCTTVHEFWKNHGNAKCEKNYIEQLRTRARYQASQRDRGVLTRQGIVQLQQQHAALKAALKHHDGSLDACLDRIRDLNEELQTALDDRDQHRSKLSKEFDDMQLVQDAVIDKLEKQNTKIAELREDYKTALLNMRTVVASTPTVSLDHVSETIQEMLDRHDKDSGEVKEEEEDEEEEEEQAEMKPAGDEKVIKKEDV